MSGIDALLEWIDSEALDGGEETLVRSVAQFEVGGHDLFDHVGHLPIGNGGPQQCAEFRGFVGTTAKRDLIELFAVLLHPQYADIADMMMPAGIDAAGDVDVQLPEITGKVEIAKAMRQLLGDRYGAGIGKTAIIEARTGDDVGDEADIGGGYPDAVERAP